MPTLLDKAMQSRVRPKLALFNDECKAKYSTRPHFSVCASSYSEIGWSRILTFLPSGFAGIVTAVAAWSIWGGDLFPADKEPIGGE